MKDFLREGALTLGMFLVGVAIAALAWLMLRGLP